MVKPFAPPQAPRTLQASSAVLAHNSRWRSPPLFAVSWPYRGWGYVTSPNGRSRPSSMNSPPRKYPRSTTYSFPRSRSRRAEYGLSIPVLAEMLTTRTLRPSKSTFPPRLAASIASSYVIRVGLSCSVMQGSLPSGPAQSTVTSLAANIVELSFCQLRCNARYDRPHKYPLAVTNALPLQGDVGYPVCP
jgi:hypothetical protein